jgi:hypothetical protein
VIRQRTSNQYAGKNVKGREATHGDHHEIMVRRLRASTHLPRPITAVGMLTVRRSPGVLRISKPLRHSAAGAGCRRRALTVALGCLLNWF